MKAQGCGAILRRSGAPRGRKAIEPREKLRHIVEAALGRKALDLVILDLEGRTSFCDWFVICSGTHPRHVKAIAAHVLETCKKQHGLRPLGSEGLEAGRWALLDFDDVLVHVFEQPARRYYDIEGLWLDARRVPLQEIGVEAPETPVEDELAARYALP